MYILALLMVAVIFVIVKYKILQFSAVTTNIRSFLLKNFFGDNVRN